MLNSAVVNAMETFLDCVGVFFIIYMIGYSTFMFLSVVVGAEKLYQRRREIVLNNVSNDDYFVPVSIIVPAYNEEVTVVETVKSLIALEYKLYEIIVVDDGSKDGTAQKLIEAFNMKQINKPVRYQIQCKPIKAIYEAWGEEVPITLISKENGGKADALNMGINASQYPYFVCMDADSMLQYDSLREIVRPVLENGNVVAVGGSVRPANGAEMSRGRILKYRLPKNLLACMQTLEYDRSFLAARILLDSFNGSMIISGAFGLFKKEIVIRAGGYDSGTMGEDMELVVKMHEYCVNNDMDYSIKYASSAICWSQVPEKLSDLKKQRRRWHRGLYQSLKIHRKMLGNKKYAPVSVISYPFFLLYELYSPYIEVLGLLTILLSWYLNLLNVRFMIMFFLIYAFFGVVMTITAFFSRIYTIDLKVSFTDILKALALCIFEITVLRLIMALVRAGALIGINKKNLSWGKIERKKLDYTGK